MQLPTQHRRTYHADPLANHIAANLLESLCRQADVLALFLSGSTTGGGRDTYSDVDISVVAQDKRRFQQQLPRLINRHADILFWFELHFLPNVFVFFLEPGYKFDFYLYNPGDALTTSLSDKAVPLKDAHGLLAEARSQPAPAPPVPLKDKYLALALTDLFAIRRESYRGDLFEARYNLDDARLCIATYVNLSHGHAYFGFDAFQRFLDDNLNREMALSLRANDSFAGIAEAGLHLLTLIETLGEFDPRAIAAARHGLHAVRLQPRECQPYRTENQRPNLGE